MAWLRVIAGAVRAGLAVERTRMEPLLALRGALGVGLVLAVALAVSSPAVATSAALGAFVSGTATFQPSWRPRPELALVAAAGLGASSLVGFLASDRPALYTAVIALWAAGAGMAWSMGTTSGMVASMTVAVMLVVVTFPVTLAQAFQHAGVIAAGGLAQAALVVLWPVRRWGAQRDALADAYAGVADYARRLRHDPSAAFDPSPLIVARDAAAVTPRQARTRPAELAGRRAVAERIRPVLVALADPAPGAPREGPERDRVRELLDAAGAVLDAVARSIRSGEPVRVPRRATAALALPETGPALTGTARRAGVRLVGLLGEAVETSGGMEDPDGRPTLTRPSAAGMVPEVWHAVRSQTHWSSPVFRHALRLGAVVGAGHAAGTALPGGHGYWAPLTSVMVMRPDFARTMSRGVARLAGTLAGLAVATAVIVVLSPGLELDAALAVVSVGLLFLLLRTGYAVASACITGFVVFLLAMEGGPWAPTVRDRVVQTLLGGALAFAAHVVFPAWETPRLADRLAAFLEMSGRYAEAVLRAYGDPAGRRPRAVRDALLDLREARTAWDEALARAVAEPVRHEAWSRAAVENAGSALVAFGRATLALEGLVPGRDAPPSPGAAAFAERLREATGAGAQTLRTGGTPSFAGLRTAYERWAAGAAEDHPGGTDGNGNGVRPHRTVRARPGRTNEDGGEAAAGRSTGSADGAGAGPGPQAGSPGAGPPLRAARIMYAALDELARAVRR